jgi:hypothetical protein
MMEKESGRAGINGCPEELSETTTTTDLHLASSPPVDKTETTALHSEDFPRAPKVSRNDPSFSYLKAAAGDPSVFTKFGNRPKIKRVAFETSRLMEFCSPRELVNQTGHDTWDWLRVITKELIDNCLDACEEAEIPPVIEVRFDAERGTIVIQDYGPGIPAATIKSVLDYTVRVSSREAYVSPTRGAQGNALKTLLAMAFVCDGTKGETLIEAHGVAHHIRFSVDQIRLEPMIRHVEERSEITTGTRITIFWLKKPRDNAATIKGSKAELLELVEDFLWLNPHLSLRMFWNDKQVLDHAASNPHWAKYRPCDPTSPHWYDPQRIERYMAGHIANSQKHGREKYTVREFLAEFRGLSSTIKQKRILDRFGAAHMPLAEFFGSSEKVNQKQIAALLKAMKREAKKVPARQIGVIGRDHLFKLFTAAGGQPESFQYRRKFNEIDGVPRVIEVMFGALKVGLEDAGKYLAEHGSHRRLITAVNWSAALGNPFRELGHYGEGLDALAAKLRTSSSEPIVALVHIACPRAIYLDRGKSSIVVE